VVRAHDADAGGLPVVAPPADFTPEEFMPEIVRNFLAEIPPPLVKADPANDKTQEVLLRGTLLPASLHSEKDIDI
jgi:hypothetical protein